MSKTLKLPEFGRGKDYLAEVTLKDKGDRIIASDEWINAPGRGEELFAEMENKLQEEANRTGKPVHFIVEPCSLGGKGLIAKMEGYVFKGRSSSKDPVYQKIFNPEERNS